ncbi:C-C motif chemokine 19 [Amia ocellicauda]|uniref:C-C motif chemokine 19 n=1 Tax=Amia ocellicauda TaxID=2972642 RepID=UPI0034638D44
MNIMAVKAVALLLVASVLWNYAEASYEGAFDCCLSTKSQIIPRRIVKSYSTQTAREGCMIPAVLFKVKKGMTLCAPPDAQWVKQLMTFLDKKTSKPTTQRKRKPTRRRGKKY